MSEHSGKELFVCSVDLVVDDKLIPANTPFELKDGQMAFTADTVKIDREMIGEFL